jgi:hypothetical protein
VLVHFEASAIQTKMKSMGCSGENGPRENFGRVSMRAASIPSSMRYLFAVLPSTNTFLIRFCGEPSRISLPSRSVKPLSLL